MSSEKSVHLKLNISDFSTQGLAHGFADRNGGNDAMREEADAKEKERFESLLHAEPKKSEKPSAIVLSSAGPAGPAGPKLAELMLEPLSIFKSQTVISHSQRSPTAAELLQRVDHLIGRMMVGDGRSGNRQVRIELKDDQLSGVTLTVQHLDARMQIDFVCSVESSRMQLNRAAPELAKQLAERLKQDVLLRVQTDDDEDLCLLEIIVKA